MTQLRDLLAKATPRPWGWDIVSVDRLYGEGVYDRLAMGHEDDGTIDPDLFGGEATEADAELVVAAINALPQLLDVADAAQDVVDAGRSEIEDGMVLHELAGALAALNKDAK